MWTFQAYKRQTKICSLLKTSAHSHKFSLFLLFLLFPFSLLLTGPLSPKHTCSLCAISSAACHLLVTSRLKKACQFGLLCHCTSHIFGHNCEDLAQYLHISIDNSPSNLPHQFTKPACWLSTWDALCQAPFPIFPPLSSTKTSASHLQSLEHLSFIWRVARLSKFRFSLVCDKQNNHCVTAIWWCAALDQTLSWKCTKKHSTGAHIDSGATEEIICWLANFI